MYIHNLNILQQRLRDYDQILPMVEFVRHGGIFDAKSLSNHSNGNYSLITVNIFEDGEAYIHDGLHRAVSILLAGRDWLYASEFRYSHLTYADYMAVNLEIGYITPFDVKTHVRLPDFLRWKETALMLFRGLNVVSPTEDSLVTRNLMDNWLDSYTEPRILGSVEEVAKFSALAVPELRRLYGPR